MVSIVLTEGPGARPRAFASPDLAVERARASELRLRAMFEAELDFVWRTVRRLGLDEGAADDAAQETFVIAARKLDEVDVGRERSFLLGTAIRVAANVRRTRAFRDRRDVAIAEDKSKSTSDGDRASAVADDAPLPDAQVEQRQTLARLDRALNEMPDELREVIVLTELDALPQAEIALLLDLPVGTVASRLRRARRDLAATMLAFEEESSSSTSGSSGSSNTERSPS
jgi:RNA polymerase sigma-70 factor (ECF subfamily)